MRDALPVPRGKEHPYLQGQGDSEGSEWTGLALFPPVTTLSSSLSSYHVFP